MAPPTVQVYWFNLALTGSSSCLSLIGGFVIILTYIKMKEIRNYTRTLLVYLTIADLLTASGNLVATIRYFIVMDAEVASVKWAHNCSTTDEVMYEPVCVGQSFVTTISNLSSFLWTAIIATHIFVSVVWKSRKTEVTCVHVMFHVISWGIPVAIVTPLLVKGYLGEDSCYGTGVWCGIRSGLPRETIRWLMYLADIVWQLGCYLLATVLYISIKFRFWLKRKYAPPAEFEELTDNLRNEDKNFLYVWLVIYSLKLWGIIRFLISTYTSEETVANNDQLQNVLMGLLFLQSYGASGQAFWNFILFCVCDKEVREHLKRYVPCKLDREMKVFSKRKREAMQTERDLLVRSINDEDPHRNSYV